MLPYLELPPVKLLLHRTTPKVLPPLRRDSSHHASVEIKGCYGRLSRDGLPIFGGEQTLGMCTTYPCYSAGTGTGNDTTEAAAYGEYPKKQISKEVTDYNQVFYPESRSLLRHYSRDKEPSGAFRLPTRMHYLKVSVQDYTDSMRVDSLLLLPPTSTFSPLLLK